ADTDHRSLKATVAPLCRQILTQSSGVEVRSFVSFFYCYANHSDLHSFPTRRSSDLARGDSSRQKNVPRQSTARRAARTAESWIVDRKSTRLNSSHLGISYAVFCLKKKITNVCVRHL